MHVMPFFALMAAKLAAGAAGYKKLHAVLALPQWRLFVCQHKLKHYYYCTDQTAPCQDCSLISAMCQRAVSVVTPEMQKDRRRLMESLKLTVNHVARLERLLGFLSPEEQLIIDRMLVNPYKNCTLDLMETLHLEKSQIYNLRAGAMKKLLRLRYGAGAGE